MADAYTLENLQALQAAIASGARKVKYGDRETEYRSLQDMLRIEKEMKQALGLTAPESHGYLEYRRD